MIGWIKCRLCGTWILNWKQDPVCMKCAAKR